MRFLIKRIKSTPFTVVHYVGLLVMLYYPYVTNILARHAHVVCTSDQDDMPCANRTAEAALYTFLLVVICYLMKNLLGYLISMVFMKSSFIMISESALFDYIEIKKYVENEYPIGTDFRQEIMEGNYIATGLNYFDIFTKIGQGIRVFLVVMFMWALYLAIKRYMNEPKKKKVEPVNPELEREGNNRAY